MVRSPLPHFRLDGVSQPVDPTVEWRKSTDHKEIDFYATVQPYTFAQIHNAVGVAVACAHPKCRISLYHSAPPMSLAADVHYAQMIELRRLARVRTKAMYGGDAAKVNRTQDRIKYLKWQIETNC